MRGGLSNVLFVLYYITYHTDAHSLVAVSTATKRHAALAQRAITFYSYTCIREKVCVMVHIWGNSTIRLRAGTTTTVCVCVCVHIPVSRCRSRCWRAIIKWLSSVSYLSSTREVVYCHCRFSGTRCDAITLRAAAYHHAQHTARESFVTFRPIPYESRVSYVFLPFVCSQDWYRLERCGEREFWQTRFVWIRLSSDSVCCGLWMSKCLPAKRWATRMSTTIFRSIWVLIITRVSSFLESMCIQTTFVRVWRYLVGLRW